MKRSAAVIGVALVGLGVGCRDEAAPKPGAAATTTSTAASTTSAAASATSSAASDDEAYAQKLAGEFGAALKKELMAGMQRGGPTEAIEVCSEKAPGIASSLGVKDGWTIRRTSLKVRNPDNAPDAWEKEVLQRFESDKAAGKPVKDLAVSKTVDGEFRFMSAIDTVGLCVTCHGDNLAPDVRAALDEKYPEDQARGFSVGDIRGAFTVRRKL